MTGPDVDVDVVVVGGGIAGVSVGYELAAELRVAVLEAEAELARHTTGRSAATYLRSYGNATVRALTAASRADFDRFVHELGTPPLLSARPMLWVADADSARGVPALLAAAAAEHLRPVAPAEACRRCPALRPEVIVAAVLDETAMDIDVMALHAGYLRGLRQRGGVVRTRAAVTSLRRDGDGWQVQTRGAGGYRCRAVVNAAGAWADLVAGLAGVAPVGLTPFRRTLFTTPVSWAGSIADWPLVVDVLERFYFKPEGDQLLVSPADETPAPPGDARPEDVDIALALERVNAVTTLGLRSVRTAWAGLRSFVRDRSPVVGERAGEPGFCWYAGQGGYGIQLAPALARTAAALLLGRGMPDDVAAAGVRPDQLGPDRLTAVAPPARTSPS